MVFIDNQSGRTILEGYLPLPITLAGVVVVGDLIGCSAGWKQADGNNSIYAELIAGQIGVSGDKIAAYRIARIGGIATGTAGNTLYLSDVAGQYAASAGTVSQCVGFETGNGEMLIEPMNIVLTGADLDGYVAIGAGAPRIKMVKLTGTSPAGGASATIAHGLDKSKIIGAQALISNNTGNRIPPNFTSVGSHEFDFFIDTTNVYIYCISGNSASIDNNAFTVLLTYEE